MSVKQRERWFLLLNMLRFTYLVSVEIFFFFSLCNEYFRKRGVLDQRHNLRCLIYSCSADSGHFASICVNLYIFKWKQVLTPLKALLAAVNHRGRLCCPFRNAMGTESLGLGRGGGATRFQSWWSFRDKVIMLIIPRSFFFFFLPLNWTLCLSQLWLPFWTVSLGGLDACLGWVNSWMKIFSLAVFKMLPPFKSWTLWQQSAFCPDYHCHFGRSFPAEQTMEF